MKANELRIGNYFKYGDKTFKVLGICNDIVLANSNRGKIDFCINDIEYITLTEEWLLKFGYSQIRAIHRTYSKSNYNDNSTIYNYKDYLHQQTGVKIEYVHQLQNLYFALTGEELILKS